MRPKYKEGDTYTKTTKGVVYLMQVQPKGRAIAIKRITPYTNPNKANKLSKIPDTLGVNKVTEKQPKKKMVKSDQVINGIRPLNENKHIHIAENDRTGKVTPVRVDSRTIKLTRVA